MFVVVAALVAACAPKADLDKAQAEVSRLTGELASLQKVVDSQRATIVELERRQRDIQAQLSQTSQQLTSASLQLSSAEQKLARKPDLPVAVRFRRAALGPGYVAVFSTTVKQDIPVLVTFRSRAFGTAQQFRMHLHSAAVSELGHAEGAALEPDDELLLENQNFSPATVKVPAQR